MGAQLIGSVFDSSRGTPNGHTASECPEVISSASCRSRGHQYLSDCSLPFHKTDASQAGLSPHFKDN